MKNRTNPATARCAPSASQATNRNAPGRGDIVTFAEPPGVAERYGDELYDKGRKWIVLTPSKYNDETRMADVCPVSSKQISGDYELSIPRIMLTDGSYLEGKVCLHQIRPVDYQSRGWNKVGQAGAVLVKNIITTHTGKYSQ
jgi:mRNA-degrading endonuclease toxin of MazEF toxin-antitoxin module